MASAPTIFVSHSHSDNAWCRPFVQALADAGLDVWYDETGLSGGAQWLARIEQEIQTRETLLLVLTPEAWASEWVKRELHLATATNKTILPVLLKDTAISGFLLTVQYVPCVGLNGQDAARHVLRALHLNTSPAKPVPTQPPSPALALGPAPSVGASPQAKSPTRRAEPKQPAPAVPPVASQRAPEWTTAQDEMPVSLDSLQQMSESYTAYIDRVTGEIDQVIAMLRAELRENDAKEASFRPTHNELLAIERLQRSGVTAIHLLDRMVEQGEDWLMMTMRRLDHFERSGLAPKDYSTWCEHALGGAYDWLTPPTEGGTRAR